MILIAIAYLGGVLTILSPCILPVLPFVFARSGRSFGRSTLPLLAGMVITFAAVASLAAVGGSWAVNANQYGRYAAMILMAFFAMALLFPPISEWAARPLVALGNRLSQTTGQQKESPISSFVLGVATGMLWTPCAGPILGLVLTGAALQGPNVGTSLLLFAYALGAATSLAFALLAGGRIFSAMKRFLGTDLWIRRVAGVLVLCAVAAIFSGLDTGLLTRLSLASTTWFEQALIDTIEPERNRRLLAGPVDASDLSARLAFPRDELGNPIEWPLPPLSGAVAWLNSDPLTPETLRGKVVLIDFWTYSCINCLRTMPYTRAWAEKYKNHGLVVIGVHTPEFAFEHNIANVRRAAQSQNITYPIAIDNMFAIWREFDNRYWPAHYFVDAQGRVRTYHFGEGSYETSERILQLLLIEAGYENVPGGFVDPQATGVEAAPLMTVSRSPETYIGFLRAENFVSPGGFQGNRSKTYSVPDLLDTNQWGLTGDWTVDDEKAVLNRSSGRIVFRFHARDLHLVLGPASDGQTVRFRVRIDGKPPGDDHGVDIDADGAGTVTEQRLYQLIRLSNGVEDHTFEIEFLDQGVQAYAFTFG